MVSTRLRFPSEAPGEPQLPRWAFPVCALLALAAVWWQSGTLLENDSGLYFQTTKTHSPPDTVPLRKS